MLLDAITKSSKPEVFEYVPSLKTPMTSRSIRHMHKAYKTAPSQSFWAKDFRANERLAAKYSIDGYIIRDLNLAPPSWQETKKQRHKAKYAS